MPGSRLRCGTVLLEPLVALLVVVVAGLAALTAVAGLRDTASAYLLREREIGAARAFLDAVSLWPTAELDRRLGEHAQGPFLLSIARPEETVYVVELADRVWHKRLLWTALYRPRDLTNGP